MMTLASALTRLAVLVLISFGIAACTGKPIDPDKISQADEIPPGPGIFTGDEGQFEITF